uniref:Pleckstrin homology and RhoGEF domain containing G7 n=1 Tax=Bos indicus x Bos taurus TaxID=30522 RepID=A0A4W2ES86_BOBOX
MEKMEPSRQEVQPAACKASPPYSLESLSKKHCQNQGNLLHFDRQAPGRLTTSPTLRRLRSRGCGSVRGGACGTATGHAPPLFNKVCESTEESSHSVWPLRLHSRLPLDSERALDSAESVELQMGPGEERALPVPQDLEEGSHSQASFPRKGDHSAPSHTPGPPGPQVTQRIASVQVCLYFLQCDESC